MEADGDAREGQRPAGSSGNRAGSYASGDAGAGFVSASRADAAPDCGADTTIGRPAESFGGAISWRSSRSARLSWPILVDQLRHGCGHSDRDERNNLVACRGTYTVRALAEHNDARQVGILDAKESDNANCIPKIAVSVTPE